VIPRELLKRIRRIEIATRRKVTSRFAGGYLSTFRGQGMEFDDVRQYQPGDDIRHIDWNVTARAGEAYVKRFVVEREMTVVLVVDVSGSLAFGSGAQGKGELVNELCTLLAFLAIGNGDRVGLVLASDRVEVYIPPAKGKNHLYRVIRALLTHEPEHTGTDLGAALAFVLKVIPRHATVFLASDFLLGVGDGFARALGRLARRHDAIAVSITDPAEMELPAAGLVTVRDPEGAGVTVVDIADPKVRAEAAARTARDREAVRRLFTRHGVDHMPLSTAVSYMEPVLRFFRTRARRLR